MHLAHFYPLLPEKIATHFDINDTPNGWMTRDGFAQFYIGFLAFTAGVFLGTAGLVAKLPKLVNIPNKNYWMAPERQAASISGLRRAMTCLGAFIGLGIIAVHHLVIATCLKDKPVLDNSAFFVCVGALIAGILGFTLWSYLRFRKPSPSA